MQLKHPMDIDILEEFWRCFDTRFQSLKDYTSSFSFEDAKIISIELEELEEFIDTLKRKKRIGKERRVSC